MEQLGHKSGSILPAVIADRGVAYFAAMLAPWFIVSISNGSEVVIARGFEDGLLWLIVFYNLAQWREQMRFWLFCSLSHTHILSQRQRLEKETKGRGWRWCLWQARAGSDQAWSLLSTRSAIPFHKWPLLQHLHSRDLTWAMTPWSWRLLCEAPSQPLSKQGSPQLRVGVPQTLFGVLC